jgi:hypothetical protein
MCARADIGVEYRNFELHPGIACDGRAEDRQIQIRRQPDGVEHQRDQRADRSLRMARANTEKKLVEREADGIKPSRV